MRVTQAMLHANALRALAANLAGLDRASERVATTRRLNRPSDDPADVRRAIKLADAMAEIEQYLRNVDAGDRLLGLADTVLGRVTEIVGRARELALAGANGSLSADDRTTIAREVRQLADQVVALAATKAGDTYIFSGLRTDVAPYASATGPYQGDTGAILAWIGPGTSLPVNVVGSAVFDPVLGALDDLATELEGGGPVSGATLTALDGALTAVVDARAVVGARQNRLVLSRTALDDARLATERLRSMVEDADLAEAIGELSRREATYQAALGVTARVLSTSLIDYLR
ncbi:MAG TPA: flagellar hook-associated protein FlgL [Candidatus Binatia bacterium]|nr:flagellar hook-associated protein FlgL [Candidatus Binatia bacterium]